jgi:hypothetical protein
MCGVERRVSPHDTDADLGERRINDVGEVAGTGDEGVDQHVDVGADTDVLAELGPRAAVARTDGAGVEDLARIRHDLRVAPRQRRELGVHTESRKTVGSANPIECSDKGGLVVCRRGRRLVRVRHEGTERR